MKKIISITIALCLILSSFSLCFAATADWSTTDQQNLQNISNRLYYNNYSAAYYLYQLVSHMSTIEGYIDQIESFLQYGGHNITYWVNAISTWMSPILTAIQDIPDISEKGLLYDHPNLSGTQIPYLEDIDKGIANYYFRSATYNSESARFNNHQALLDNYNGTYSFRHLNVDGSSGTASYNWYQGSPIGNLALLLKENVNSLAIGFATLQNNSLNTQNVINWGNNSNSTFNPTSSIDGIYKYLSSIQAPVARLSYVLASDADIEAREYATANQNAVVDNFIDSNGSGSVSPSDFSSMAGASDSVKDNFNTGYSSSNVWDIFNSDHYGWFSQECADSLDTTSSNTRCLKSSSGYDTPLLDSYYEQILSLGGDN